uniref:Uncharacterized protein AlNc14C520G12029 n=1 Tax=Albugo laibachii Nc14 TaxID=890382 RepID=F0X0T5_9STRA|nr:hypothetical protein TRIADDRAFT_5525 [Albugo laibachii Nc14]CCA27608.1 hypothetical protein TRIADDRAFT_5525 [Albugo laibachii Nc14]|eukprot:CCA27608.1 hypothetical protein TRIADDRAFT_5525 [Albugo laibachii Nc14]
MLRAQIEPAESDGAAGNEYQWNRQAAALFYRETEVLKVHCGRLVSHYGISYFAKAKAWMRSDLFSAWIRSQGDIFRKQGRHVLLLMDNAPSHKTYGLKLSNIKIRKLEPNTTPFNQPLDAGIIHAFKARIRQMRDNQVVNAIGSSTADSYKSDILTSMQWATAAWRDVTEEAILNCWKHFRVLPAPGLHEVEEQDLEYTFHMESDRDAKLLCLMLDAVISVIQWL